MQLGSAESPLMETLLTTALNVEGVALFFGCMHGAICQGTLLKYET